MIRTDAKDKLVERFYDSGWDTLKEFVLFEECGCPGFYRWLFNDVKIPFFCNKLTPEQQKEVDKFINSL